MQSESVIEIGEAVESLKGIEEALENVSRSSWWDTQWFSAVIGATTAIFVSVIGKTWQERRRKLDKIYSAIMKELGWFSPESLTNQAGSTKYGHTIRDSDGEETEVAEKPLGEKTVIELRRGWKYWNYPLGKIRWLFSRYEKTLAQLPDMKKKDVKMSDAYKKAEQIYNEIQELAKRKTGENDFTVR